MKDVKTILLTGATGFVGSNLAYEFLKKGYNLKLLVREKNNDDAEERIDKILSIFFDNHIEYKNVKNKIEVITGDITFENLGIPATVLKRLCLEVDAVFHCAALTTFDEGKKKELEEQNVKGTKNVLDFTLKLSNPDFHYMSTAYICGQEDGIFYEDDLDIGQKFNNSYEESKFKAEQLINEYRKEFDIKTTIYRPSIIVGDSKTGKTTNFSGFYSVIKAIYLLIDIFKEDLKRAGKRSSEAGVYYEGNVLNIPLRIPANAGKTLNIVPIDYTVDVVLKILKLQSASGKTYHVVNPNPPTIGYVLKIIFDLFNTSGIKMVTPDEFKLKPATPWEEFFYETIRSFGFDPYLHGKEPIFSVKNTQKNLNRIQIKCPKITKKLIQKLIYYCLKSNWGKR